MENTQLSNPNERPTQGLRGDPMNDTQKNIDFETELNGGRIGVIRVIGPNFVAYCKTMEEFKTLTEKHVRESFNKANERGFVRDDGYKVDIVMLPVKVAFSLKPYIG